MQWDWGVIKEAAQRWFQKVGAFLLFQNVVGYLLACVTLGHPIGFTKYVDFIFHIVHWTGY